MNQRDQQEREKLIRTVIDLHRFANRAYGEHQQRVREQVLLALNALEEFDRLHPCLEG